MKKLLVFSALLFGMASFAQENKEEALTFNCQTSISDPDMGTMEYIGNVSFKNEIISITDADKIVYNIAANEIIVTGCYNYSFNGDIHFSSPIQNKTLTYKLGDDVAYIK